MRIFPYASISDLSLIVKLFDLIVRGYNTTTGIRKELDIPQKQLYCILDVLCYLGVIKKEKIGRRNIYSPVTKELRFKDIFLSDNFVFNVLRCIFNGLKRRKDIASKLNSNNGKLLRSISSVVSLARKLGLVAPRRPYRLTENGELLVFREAIIRIFEKARKHGQRVIEIPELRNMVSRFLIIDRKKFDSLILKLERIDNKVHLLEAPALSDMIRKEGIRTETGIIYYFSYG